MSLVPAAGGERVEDGLRLATLPNALSAVRLLLLPPILVLLDRTDPVGDRFAVVLLVVAGLTDLLDGTLARARGAVSPSGKVVDPLADKILIGGLVLYLAAARSFPVWLVALVLIRDLGLVAGAGLFFRRERIVFAADWTGKATTFFLALLILAHVLRQEAWTGPLTALATAALAASTVSYGARAWRQARSSAAAPRPHARGGSVRSRPPRGGRWHRTCPPSVVMEDLDGWYRERLVGRIEALEAARAALVHDPQGEARATARRIAHSLRGSGTTFGFPVLTSAAADLEDAPDAAVGDRLTALLAVLEGIAGRPPGPRPPVLLVDDDPAIAHLLERRLAEVGMQVLLAGSAEAAEEILARREVALVVLDLVLPDTDGRNLLIRLRERAATAAVPVVVLTVRTTPLARRECYALGADQFFEKPFDPEALAAAVAARLQQAAIRTRDARRDPLTDLPNRAAFHETFERIHALAAREDRPLSIGFVDLDRFKSINDTYGHAAGDLVLRHATHRIAGALRQSDLLARWGGEEFVALFPNTPPRGAFRALEKARAAFGAEAFPLVDRSLKLTFSAGVAPVEVDDTVEDAVARADHFLYLAKTGGRDRILTAGAAPPPPRRTIVLAEQDEDLAHEIGERLGGEGFDVVPCADAGAVLAALDREPVGGVALVILDVVLPGADDVRLLHRVKRHAQVPILMITLAGREEELSRGLEQGADDYIVKPFSPAELVTRIHRLIEAAS